MIEKPFQKSLVGITFDRQNEGSFYKSIFSSSKSHFTFLMKFDIDSKTCKYRQQLLLFIRFAGWFCAIISVNSNFKATFGPKITE